MKTKLLLLAPFALIVSTCLARPSFYVEPRVSYLHVPGTPNIGDLGSARSTDIDRAAPTFVFGYDLAPRLAVELRYTALGDVVVRKTAPFFLIFPPTSGPVPFDNSVAVRSYRYEQETSITTLALPFRLIGTPKFSARLTPLIQRADAKIDLFETSPNVLVVPPGIIHHRRETPVRAGAEISAAYALGTQAAVTGHYTYLPLPGFDAHLFGAGLNWRF